MSTSTSRRSAVTVLRFAYAPLVTDSAEAATYGEVKDLHDTLISASYTPRMNTASQYAGGQEYDSYTAKSGGTLDVQIPTITAAEEKDLFGCALNDTSGVVTSNKNDVVPNVMVIYSTQTSEGNINLYKFPKVKFRKLRGFALQRRRKLHSARGQPDYYGRKETNFRLVCNGGRRYRLGNFGRLVKKISRPKNGILQAT